MPRSSLDEPPMIVTRVHANYITNTPYLYSGYAAASAWSNAARWHKATEVNCRSANAVRIAEAVACFEENMF